MQFSICFAFALAAIVAPASAIVPQEHSHEDILRAMREILPVGTESIRNDGALPDAVFGLLGKQAADNEAPSGDGDCLQQDLADTAISIADGDSAKIATALLYRALERNSGGVGVKSALCTKAPISEILQGLTQHQDAASDGATENNEDVERTLGEKLEEIGEDPLEALRTGTFAPGDPNDFSGKGGSCNDENDAAGCINTLDLAVPIVTEAELLDGGDDAAPETAAVTAADNGADAAADNGDAAADNGDDAADNADDAAVNADDAAVNADDAGNGEDDAATLIARIQDNLAALEALV